MSTRCFFLVVLVVCAGQAWCAPATTTAAAAADKQLYDGEPNPSPSLTAGHHNPTRDVVELNSIGSTSNNNDTTTTTTTTSSEDLTFSSRKSQPVLTSGTQDTPSGSHNLLTTLSMVVLVNNLMPRPLPARWALATTAAAWLWLAFRRLLPWLPQTSPPSHAATASTAASGSDAVAAAAGLSPAATAASAMSGIGGDPSTRWWQHALLVVELFMGNATDALLIMGLLLLPVIALRRWWAGKSMWGTVTAAAAGSASAPPLPLQPAANSNAADDLAAATSQEVSGSSAELQSVVGNTTARLSKAIGRIARKARQRRPSSVDSLASTGSSRSTDSSGDRSSASGSSSSSAGSMVSPEQSALQPNTPPLLFVARPDGPLGAASHNTVPLARPLQASPTQDEVMKGRDAAASAAAAATTAAPTRRYSGPSSRSSGESSSSVVSRSSLHNSALLRSDAQRKTGSNAEGRTGVVADTQQQNNNSSNNKVTTRPGDSSGQQHDSTAAAPSGARTDSGSSIGPSAASLNLGAVRTASAHGPLPPMYPTRALYSSPMQTVVVSCKLGSTNTSANTSSTSPRASARGTAVYAVPSTTSSPPEAAASTRVGSAAPAGASGAAVGASVATASTSSALAAGGVQAPLSPTQASLVTGTAGAGGAHGSISAQRELRAVVEAAVRQAVAESSVAVLSTTVTSFPGCVHVVTTANLKLPADAATSGAESGTAAARLPWQQIVQQIINAGAASNSSSNSGHGASSAAPAACSDLLAREGLYLKHLLVQDTAGNIHFLYVSPQAAADEADMHAQGAEGITAEASVGSVRSGSVVCSEPSSPTASTSSSRSSAEASARGMFARLHSAASGISISSFTLPTDAGNEDAAVPLPDAASKLLLPAQLADALEVANAGLRIVVSANPPHGVASAAGRLATTPRHAAAAAAGRAAGSDMVSSSPGSSRANSPTAVLRRTLPDTSSSHSDEATGSMHEHLLADHTLWPGMSSWPAGAEFDLLQLLPDSLSAAALAQQYGPVLTLNLVASTRQQGAVVAHAPMAQPAAAAAGESAAGIVHFTLAAGIPDAAAPVTEQPHVQRSPSAAQQLHTDITSLLMRLQAGAPAGATAAAPVTSADPVPAPTHGGLPAGASGVTSGGSVSAGTSQPLGEHLLLQLPLLLLPAAACKELALLQQRMTGELDGDAVTAGRKHMLPLINDIAAALNMRSKPPAQPDDDAQSAHGASDMFAEAAGAAGESLEGQPQAQTSSSSITSPAAEAPAAVDAPKLTGVRALIAQREMMAAAAAAAAAASGGMSPRAGAGGSAGSAGLSPTGSSSFVLSPRARLSPARSPSWRVRSGPPSPDQSSAVSPQAAAARLPAATGQQLHEDRAQLPGSLEVTTTAAPEDQQQPAQPQEQTQPDVLNSDQKQLLKQVLQFMSDQALDTLAATLCSHLGVDDLLRELHNTQTSQHNASRSDAAAGAGATVGSWGSSTGLQEIEPAADGHTLLATGVEGTHAVSAAPVMDTLSGEVAPADAQRAFTHISSEVSASSDEDKGSAAWPVGSASADASSADGSKASSVCDDASQKSGQETVKMHSKDAAKVLGQAADAHEQAVAAKRMAAATESALQLALQQIHALSAATAQANRQAQAAEATAAAASQRAAAIEQQAERQRALQLISNPTGAAAAGTRGVGIWGLLSSSSWAIAAARAAGSSLLGGVMRAAEPPMVPQEVSTRDVLLGFPDERLEVQYRRMKALQCRSIDRAALLMQLCRQVVYVWRIARLMFVSAGTGLSLVLLCKYEAVVLLPYVVMLLTPDFYIYHRHLLLCLSHIAAALTVGMISATEVYRNEWSALLQHPGPTLLARPSMMLLWYYFLVPLLQQQTLPEQAISCVAQLAHSLLIYVYILKGTTSLMLVVPLLVMASGVSFGVSYVADAWTRQQAVAGARRSLTGGAAAG